jgi:hypothetical protein
MNAPCPKCGSTKVCNGKEDFSCDCKDCGYHWVVGFCRNCGHEFEGMCLVKDTEILDLNYNIDEGWKIICSHWGT